MVQNSTRSQRQWRKRLAISLVGSCGLTLFGFVVLHGVNETDAFYSAEIFAVWMLAVLGAGLGLRTFKRATRNQRVILSVSFALIICSISVITLFKSSSASPPAIPQPSSPD